MKLHCNKCNTTLTTDLYKTTKNKFVTTKEPYGYELEDGSVETYYTYTTHLPKDSFIYVESLVWNNKGSSESYNKGYFKVIKEPSLYITNKDSVLHVPVFKEGYGCCDYSMSDYHCPCCNEVIGEMNFDCWQDFKRVEFLKHKTHFENK